MHVDLLMVIVTNEAGQALYMGHFDPEDEVRALEDLRVRFTDTSDFRHDATNQ